MKEAGRKRSPQASLGLGAWVALTLVLTLLTPIVSIASTAPFASFAASPSSPLSDTPERAGAPTTNPPTMTVTYLANEGFLLSAGETKVLVDALFPGIRHYPKLTEDTRAELLAARPPFDEVDLVLATHSHEDHFGPAETLAFLSASPNAVLVTTPQAVARLTAAADFDPAIRARVHAIHPAEGASQTVSASGASVEVLNLHHGHERRPPIDNLGFVIHLGGFVVLHIGDTEATLPEFSAYALGSRRIDLALLPGWFLAEPKWTPVTHSLSPRALAAMHLAEPDAPPSWFGSAGSLAGRMRRIRADFPGIWIPRAALESRTFR